jgi:NADH-quinone oxidoreductase subunit N
VNEVNFPAILPEILLCAGGILIMVLEPFAKKSSRVMSALLAAAAFAGSAATAVLLTHAPTASVFHGMVSTDGYGIFFRLLFCGIGLLMTLGVLNYLQRENFPVGEFYALLLFATAGMNFMAIGTDLVMTFIGLEILSVATYVLAGFRRRDPLSNEAGLKYFFMGAFSSAILLYGIALVYGSTGTTQYGGILAYSTGFTSLRELPPVYLLGVALILVGFCFKVAAAPFQVWTPDVYQGAPTAVTAFMSVGPKAAGFAALIRVLFQTMPADLAPWTQLLLASSILTILIGNLGAIPQTNVKRMLAYSSIAHAGYILIGVVAANQTGLSAILFYTVAYALMNIGAFAIVAIVGGSGDRRVDLEDFKGLGFRQPLLSFPLTICLVSLAGIPTTAGFIGKFFLFSAAIQRQHFTLVIIAVLGSLVSVYYYLRVVVYMFMKEGDADNPVVVDRPSAVTILACSALILFFGLFPTGLLQLANSAVSMFLGR